MVTQVQDAVVLVVGGTSGIGLATARRLAESGAWVVLGARDPERLVEVAGRLGPRTGHAVIDLRDPVSVDAAIAAVLAEHGRIDAVVTSAQAMAYGSVEEVPPEVFDAVVDTAVGGTYHLARAVLPHFRDRGTGSLVVVSSLLAEIAVPSLSAYCTAKWGQLGLVRSLQLEVADQPGISVSLVLPGAIDTPIYDQAGTYAGQAGTAPPPVVAPEWVARAIVRALVHPRRLVHVGPANWPTVVGFRLLPGVYDRLAPTLVRRVVLRGGSVEASAGNVLGPTPRGEGLRGGWTLLGLRRRRRGE